MENNIIYKNNRPINISSFQSILNKEIPEAEIVTKDFSIKLNNKGEIKNVF